MNITAIAKRLSLLVLLIAPTAGWAAESMVPAPSQLAAKPYVLMDGESGQVLVENNDGQRPSPASLTKLMTTYIATKEIEAGRIGENDLVTASEHAWHTGDSRMFIKVGSQVPVSDLLHGITIQSGNGASVALAEYIADSEDAFTDIMSTTAQKLGPTNSHFMDTTGLPNSDHYFPAHDMAMLARAIIYGEPSHYAIYAQKEFLWNSIKQPNRDLLLWHDKTVDGLRTGRTDEADYCLVASTVHGGQRMIAVVSGTNSEQAHAAETRKLLIHGFRSFEGRSFYKKGTELTKGLAWKSSEHEVKAGLVEDLTTTLPRGQVQKPQASMVLEPQLIAPIQQGQVIGRVEVKLDDKVIRSADLVALNAVEEGGFFRRPWDSIRLFFYGLFNRPTGARPLTRPAGARPREPRVRRHHD